VDHPLQNGVLALSAALALDIGAANAQPSQPADQGRPSVGAVVAKMQTLYNGTRDLKGKFKQVYSDRLYERTRTSYGYLFVKKPGKMRWNYVKPEKKAFISDGKVLWVWEPEAKQAFRNPLDASTLSTGVTFLLGSGDLSEEFDIRYAGPQDKLQRANQIVLRLDPKQPTAQYDHLLFVLRPEDHVVTESMVVSRHSTNHLIYSQLKFNTRLGDRRFRFDPPADTRVIDSSKLSR
jgi:outer membrane lipoprotein carrier protein